MIKSLDDCNEMKIEIEGGSLVTITRSDLIYQIADLLKGSVSEDDLIDPSASVYLEQDGGAINSKNKREEW